MSALGVAGTFFAAWTVSRWMSGSHRGCPSPKDVLNTRRHLREVRKERTLVQSPCRVIRDLPRSRNRLTDLNGIFFIKRIQYAPS